MSRQVDIAASITQPVSIARKRQLGAFYTPATVAKILCNWAIRSTNDVILEPSFGGCTFLEASISRIQELGSDVAMNLYGCDIDPNAFEFLRAFSPNIKEENFHQCDFLEWDEDKFPNRYVDVVIGNPPYVSYSKLNTLQKEVTHRWERRYGERLNRRASLWAYFTLHTFNFLKEGGRMAWVLPTSLMTASYAEKVRSYLAARFKKIVFYTLSERIFLMEGTEERAVIILAEGYGKQHSSVDITTEHLENMTDLATSVACWQRQKTTAHTARNTFGQGLVPIDAKLTMDLLEEGPQVFQLGELVQVEIGVVSGNAKYFIKTIKDWQTTGVPRSFLTYIAPKSRWITGLCLSENDKKTHEESGVPCLALDAPILPQDEALLEYLASYNEEEILRNETFKRRAKWFRFLEGKVPDAFFVFMTHLGPRLVVNDAKVDATNGVYRIQLRPEIKEKVQLLAISLQTTFTQLAAEQLGSARGSGALKLEPRDVKLLPVCLPEKTLLQTRETFTLIDKYMRTGNPDLARKTADQFIFSNSQAFQAAQEKLDNFLKIARRRRMRLDTGNSTI